MDNSFIYIFLGIGGLLVFFYFIAPRLKMISYRSNIIRSIIFFGIVGYLAYDFYVKEKYTYIFVLLLGSSAFIWMLLSMRKDDKKGK